MIARIIRPGTDAMRLLLALCLACLFAACATQRETAAVAYGVPFTLAAGQSAALPDRSVLRYIETANDSRCPLDAQCIWAGDAEVRFEWRRNASMPAENFSLHTGKGEGSRMLAGHRLTLESLARGEAPPVALKLD